MKKWAWVGISLVAIVAFIGLVWWAVHARRQRQAILNQPNVVVENGNVQTRFIGNGLDTSPDSLALNRVIRGTIVSTDFTNTENNPFGFLTVSVQLNWPDPEPQRVIPFQLMPNTEFLCWGTDFETADGNTSLITQTPFLIDETRKLEVKNEKPLVRDQALVKLLPNTPVILALSRSYVVTSVNQVFQVGVIGCQ